MTERLRLNRDSASVDRDENIWRAPGCTDRIAAEQFLAELVARGVHDGLTGADLPGVGPVLTSQPSDEPHGHQPDQQPGGDERPAVSERIDEPTAGPDPARLADKQA